MSRLLVILLGICLLNLRAMPNFDLVGKDSHAVLELPDEAYRPQLEEFSQLIRQTTGVSLPLVTPDHKGQENRVTFALHQENDVTKQDIFSFAFPAPKTMRISCTQVSLKWALNRILEDYAGVRFLMPEYCGTSLVQRKRIRIPKVAKEYRPSFWSRCLYFSTEPWQLSNNLRPSVQFNHEQWSVVFPSRRYTQEGYPPAIMPVHGGKRLKTIPNPRRPAQFWQPCYSNPESARLAAQNIIAYLRNHPKVTTVSLTINDNGGFCECDQCRKANGGDKGYNHSDVYFKWVNRVAEQVTKEFPHIMLPALAYAEVLTPPSFKIHPNVPILICLDLYAVTDPAVKKKNKAMISEWASKASILGTWDYAWGYYYALPRIYFKEQVEMMRYLHQHKARIYFLEYEAADCHEGPKSYLYSKLLWDINADVDALLQEWYQRAVGPKAAPYLKGYFDFWEAYFAGSEVRKTPWFASARYTYMTWGVTNHMYGLKKGDLAKARSLMENVVRLAETKEQKQRAELFMRRFEMTETIATLHGAEPMPANGLISTWQEARAICKNIAQSAPFIDKQEHLKALLAKEPIIGKEMYKYNMGRVMKFNPNAVLAEQLSQVTDFATHPKVKAALAGITQNQSLPESIRQMAAYLNGSLDLPNDCAGGDFEHSDQGLNVVKVKGTGEGTQKIVPLKKHGKGHVLRITPGRLTTISKTLKAQPNSLYLVTFKLFLPQVTSETFLRNTLFAATDGELMEWWEVAKNFVPAGKWVTIAMLGNVRDTANELRFSMDLGNFEPNQVAFLDDLTQIRIGDSVKVKPLDLSKSPAILPEKDGFRNLELQALRCNKNFSKDITITMRTYKDGNCTALLKGSSDGNLSHFFYNGAPIMANRGDTLILNVKVKGKGQFTYGAYVKNEQGDEFYGTHATNTRLEEDDYEVLTHEVKLTGLDGNGKTLQLRPVIGFIGGGGQAEVVSFQYKIVK